MNTERAMIRFRQAMLATVQALGELRQAAEQEGFITPTHPLDLGENGVAGFLADAEAYAHYFCDEFGIPTGPEDLEPAGKVAAA